MTAFNRRAFLAVMALEESDDGYDFSLLGEDFSPDEMGRLAKLEQARRALSENGTSVLRAAIETLRRERSRQAVKEAAPLDGINLILAEKRKKMQKEQP